MQDPISAIEQALKAQLLTIDESTPTAAGYQYYKTVKTVNIDDEAVAIDREGYPLINIKMLPYERPSEAGADCTTYTLTFELLGMVELSTEYVDTPQYNITEELNKLATDIKACLYSDRSLNCTADMVVLRDISRVPTTRGDVRRASDLKFIIEVSYTTLNKNPNIRR